MKTYDINNHPAVETLEKLRKNMEENLLDWLVIYYADPHLGEFISKCDDYFEELSGFTGDSATLLISMDFALLWTDGRYFIQAEHELAGSGITLMKDGLPDTPSLSEYLKSHVWDGQRIGFDFKTISYNSYQKLKNKLPDSVEFIDAYKIIKDSLSEKITRSFNTITCVTEEASGKRREDKLAEVRDIVRRKYVTDEEKSYSYIVSGLSSNMWLFNLRGADVPYIRAAYSYSVITDYSATLYICKKYLTGEALASLADSQIVIKEYSTFYKDICDVASDYVLVDDFATNACICNSVSDFSELIFVNNHDIILKYIKNPAEISGMKNAGIKDAVTMCKFIMKIKELAREGKLSDEYNTGKMLDDMRMEGGASSLSFATICAYDSNAAIVHYEAEENSCSKLEAKGMLLVDSGGHYNSEGTTDITRTIALGEVSEEEKRIYTSILIGNLRLMNVRFTQGTVGQNIDIIARQPIWESGYDFSHGTGHGVGCDLEVHEAPIRISCAIGRERVNNYPLKPGMITSDEPGVYVQDKFGVRLENLLLTVDKSDENMKMLGFEPITYVPFELELIDKSIMSSEDIKMLNDYHQMVRNVIFPQLDEVAQNWLNDATKCI